MDRDNLIREEDYLIMPAIRDTWPAQIPITASRFIYLTKQYKPCSKGSRWVMFHHPGHFMIYDNESRYCIFDGTYTMLDYPDDQFPDALAAVVYDIRICPEEYRSTIFKDDGFKIFADLLCDDL